MVVGYYGEDWYLIADPNGFFSWYHKDTLEAGWSLDSPGISENVPNAFSVEGIGVWIAAELADIGLGSNNVVVPRYAPTSHFGGYWSEMQGIYVSGSSKLFGKTHGWDRTLTFSRYPDFYTVSEIELLSSTGTATVDGHRRVGGNGVQVWGRIEDGIALRGRMWVVVRTLYEAGPTRGTPRAVYPKRHTGCRNCLVTKLSESVQPGDVDPVSSLGAGGCDVDDLFRRW